MTSRLDWLLFFVSPEVIYNSSMTVGNLSTVEQQWNYTIQYKYSKYLINVVRSYFYRKTSMTVGNLYQNKSGLILQYTVYCCTVRAEVKPEVIYTVRHCMTVGNLSITIVYLYYSIVFSEREQSPILFNLHCRGRAERGPLGVIHIIL